MLSLNQQEKEYLFILGFCYLQQQKFERAGTVFRALHAVFPNDLLATKSLAYLLFATNKQQEAEKLFEQLSVSSLTNQDRVWANFMRLMLKTKKPRNQRKPLVKKE